jgi:hypothetical protein
MARDGTGRDYWDRHARNYDRSMAIFGGPIPRMVDLAADAVRGSARVLEVAAGTGLVTASRARRGRGRRYRLRRRHGRGARGAREA